MFELLPTNMGFLYVILALGVFSQGVTSFFLDKRAVHDYRIGEDSEDSDDSDDSADSIPKILNGDLATLGEFPFIVSLQTDGDHFCGGSVISKYWIVTAAHCFPDKELSENTKARSGTLKYNEGGIVHDLEKLIINSKYNEGSLINNDIALLKVKEPFDDSYVKFVRITDSKDPPQEGTEVISAGWGITTTIREEGVASIDLLRVTLSVVDRKQCNNLAGIREIRREQDDNLKVTKNMICARNEGKDTCSGDSGGPLLRRDGDEFVLVGVVSWGQGHGKADSPGVYTNLANYRKWIHMNAQ